jgi:hypothetical protein
VFWARDTVEQDETSKAQHKHRQMGSESISNLPFCGNRVTSIRRVVYHNSRTGAPTLALTPGKRRYRTSGVLVRALVRLFELGVIWVAEPMTCEDHSVTRPSRRDLVAHRPAEGVLMKKTLSPSLMVFQPSFIC